eukprot:scaffold4470_cov255-Prasinococcus_capsulatus_cf.AAC.15
MQGSPDVRVVGRAPGPAAGLEGESREVLTMLTIGLLSSDSSASLEVDTGELGVWAKYCATRTSSSKCAWDSGIGEIGWLWSAGGVLDKGLCFSWSCSNRLVSNSRIRVSMSPLLLETRVHQRGWMPYPLEPAGPARRRCESAATWRGTPPLRAAGPWPRGKTCTPIDRCQSTRRAPCQHAMLRVVEWDEPCAAGASWSVLRRVVAPRRCGDHQTGHCSGCSGAGIAQRRRFVHRRRRCTHVTAQQVLNLPLRRSQHQALLIHVALTALGRGVLLHQKHLHDGAPRPTQSAFVSFGAGWTGLHVNAATVVGVLHDRIHIRHPGSQTVVGAATAVAGLTGVATTCRGVEHSMREGRRGLLRERCGKRGRGRRCGGQRHKWRGSRSLPCSGVGSVKLRTLFKEHREAAHMLQSHVGGNVGAAARRTVGVAA